jgi:hypothetical protein
MGVINYAVSRSKYQIGKILRRQKFTFDSDIQHIVDEVKEYGFSIFPNFYSQLDCIHLKTEIDRIIEIRKQKKCLWVDPYGADKRCYGAEDDSRLIADFCNNEFIQSIADNVFEAKMSCSNTLAARIEYKEGNIGSGQGWHRDGNHFQFKALVYLTDVELKDGPFQLLTGSHKPESILKNIKLNRYDGTKLRFDNQEIERLIKSETNELKVFTAKAGTLVFFDSSCLHTGSPLSSGGLRYALTNYYYPSYEDIKARKEEFLNAFKK